VLGSIPDDAALSDGVPEARRGEHETLTPQARPAPAGESGEKGAGQGQRQRQRRAVSRLETEQRESCTPPQVPPSPPDFPRERGAMVLPSCPGTRRQGRLVRGGQEGNFRAPSRQPATLLLFYTCAPRPETDGTPTPRGLLCWARGAVGQSRTRQRGGAVVRRAGDGERAASEPARR